MFYWIHDLPTWTMVFMVCASFVGVTLGRADDETH